METRKPHIHIVIPNINLKTGASMNPWGGVYKHHEIYFDAIQEAMNLTFGLISPSQSRRTNFTMESSVHERTKGDDFKGNNIRLKQLILDTILENNISSTEDLRHLLKTMGEQITRNKGKQNEYEAIKPYGSSKFVNLRHFVFSALFLQLTPDRKIKLLNPKNENGFITTGVSKEIPNNLDTILTEWHRLRSKQIKYLDRNAPAYYKLLSNQEKISFLKRKETDYYRNNKALNYLNFPSYPTPLQLQEIVIGRPPASSSKPPAEYDFLRDSAISQLLRDRTDTPESYAPELNALVPGWNATINLNFMLADLVYSHGLIRDKYQTSGQEEPGEPPIARDRIQRGKRHLSASDFLRLEMRMPWPIAYAYMRQTMERQQTFVPNLDPLCGVPDTVLWLRFTQNTSILKKEVDDELKRCLDQLISSSRDAKTVADLQHSYGRFMMFEIKMPDHIRKLCLALIDDEYHKHKGQVAGDLRQTRQQLKSQRLSQGSWGLYLSFLHKNALVAPTYLAELRKHAAAHEVPRDSFYLTGRPDAEVNDVSIVNTFGLTRTVAENGDVLYKRNGDEFLRDEGGFLVANTASGTPAIQAAMILAKDKWGVAYNFGGPLERQTIAKALALTLPVKSPSGGLRDENVLRTGPGTSSRSSRAP